MLLFVCLSWGANAPAIKISNTGLPPLLVAAIRDLVAAGLVLLYAAWKRERVWMPPGAVRHGMIIGTLFGLDFLFLYWGVFYTTASRSTIFLYTHPFWVAVGAHFFLRDDRLTPIKLIGLILAFSGVVAVFSSRDARLPPDYLIGDVMEMIAAIFWAMTTLYLKRMAQNLTLSHYQTLFNQLLFSVPVLAGGSLLFESYDAIVLTGPVAAALAYQILVVAFFSYNLWFWMIHAYPVSKLTAFTFFAPLFGVIIGAVGLGEPVAWPVWLGIGLVGAGIYLVNRSGRARAG